jgi:hypothetical protein
VGMRETLPHVVWTLKVPLFVAVLCVLLVIPETLISIQMREAVRNTTNGTAPYAVYQLGGMTVAAAWLSLCIHHTALIRIRLGHLVGPHVPVIERSLRYTLTVSPLVVTATLLSEAQSVWADGLILLASLSLWTIILPKAIRDMSRTVFSQSDPQRLAWAPALPIVTAVGVLWAVIRAGSIFSPAAALLGALSSCGVMALVLSWLGASWNPTSQITGPSVIRADESARASYAFLGLTVVAGLVTSAFVATDAVSSMALVGTPAVMLLGLAFWTAATVVIGAVSRLTRIPLGALLILMLLVSSATNWNDNHGVRLVSTEHMFERDLPSDLGQGATRAGQFDVWLENRQDWADFAGKPYPVFVIATEGGGLRAAYFTARVLAALQDRCPSFAEHIYGISGVSGGSVGAAVFAAHMRLTPRPSAGSPCFASSGAPTGTSRLVDSVLRTDFLTPTLARLLFTDAMQQFAPWDIWRTDRADALDLTLQRRWNAVTGCGKGHRTLQCRR